MLLRNAGLRHERSAVSGVDSCNGFHSESSWRSWYEGCSGPPELNPRPDEHEATEAKFVDVNDPPQPLHVPTKHALGLLRGFLESGLFQVR